MPSPWPLIPPPRIECSTSAWRRDLPWWYTPVALIHSDEYVTWRSVRWWEFKANIPRRKLYQLGIALDVYATDETLYFSTGIWHWRLRALPPSHARRRAAYAKAFALGGWRSRLRSLFW